MARRQAQNRAHAVFPAPDHNHARCEADAMAHAEKHCGKRLTPIRRQVLRTLLGSHQPLGAYDIIQRMGRKSAAPAPITVYRALDFLREEGLVHRIESRNAFIACAAHHHDEGAPIVFMLCEKCGGVGESASEAIADTIKSASRAAGFTPKAPVIEIAGVCSHCRK